MVVRSRATDERSASKCQGKWPDQTLCDSFGAARVDGSGPRHQPGLSERGKIAKMDVNRESSGDSRFSAFLVHVHKASAPVDVPPYAGLPLRSHSPQQLALTTMRRRCLRL
jgi:hypothetical protein